MNPFTKGVIYVVLSASGFGVMSIFALFAYQAGATVPTLLFLRFLLAAALFFLLLFAKKEIVKPTKRQLLALFGLGGVLYTLQSFSFFSAVSYIPASLAALLLYTFPVFVAILAFLLEKERLTKQTVISILLSLVGLTLVLGTSFGKVSMLGISLALGAAVFYSVYIILGNRVVKGLPPEATSAFVSLFAAISVLGIASAKGGLQLAFGLQGWLAVLGIVLFSTVLAIGCFFRGLQLIGSTKASILSTVEPVVTIIFSALLLSERLTWLQGIGGIIVLLGAVLIVVSRSKQEQNAAV